MLDLHGGKSASFISSSFSPSILYSTNDAMYQPLPVVHEIILYGLELEACHLGVTSHRSIHSDSVIPKETLNKADLTVISYTE